MCCRAEAGHQSFCIWFNTNSLLLECLWLQCNCTQIYSHHSSKGESNSKAMSAAWHSSSFDNICLQMKQHSDVWVLSHEPWLFEVVCVICEGLHNLCLLHVCCRDEQPIYTRMHMLVFFSNAWIFKIAMSWNLSRCLSAGFYFCWCSFLELLHWKNSAPTYACFIKVDGWFREAGTHPDPPPPYTDLVQSQARAGCLSCGFSPAHEACIQSDICASLIQYVQLLC